MTSSTIRTHARNDDDCEGNTKHNNYLISIFTVWRASKSFRTRSNSSFRLAARTTLQPARKNVWARASPSPELAPVISTTCEQKKSANHTMQKQSFPIGFTFPGRHSRYRRSLIMPMILNIRWGRVNGSHTVDKIHQKRLPSERHRAGDSSSCFIFKVHYEMHTDWYPSKTQYI